MRASHSRSFSSSPVSHTKSSPPWPLAAACARLDRRVMPAAGAARRWPAASTGLALCGVLHLGAGAGELEEQVWPPRVVQAGVLVHRAAPEAGAGAGVRRWDPREA